MANFTIKISPQKPFGFSEALELYKYKELLLVFALRDIKVRYKQTFFGVGWALFQPLFSTFVFTVFFGRIASIRSGELPYSIFVLIGLIFWTYFAGIVSSSSNSLIENENIIKKVFFPRAILPLSSIPVNMLDFGISFSLFLAISLIMNFQINIMFLVASLFGLLIATLAAAGLGLLTSAINVRYRDVRYALPFFIQSMVFFTPVIYPTEIIKSDYKYLLAINPMTGVIELARSSFQNIPPDTTMLAISVTSSFLLLLIGLFVFHKSEKWFADLI